MNISNRSKSKTTRRLKPGQNIQLIAFYIVKTSKPLFSVRQICDWLSQNYPQYSAKRHSIQRGFREDSKRKKRLFFKTVQSSSRPAYWALRPGMESELRQCLNGCSMLDHQSDCILCNRKSCHRHNPLPIYNTATNMSHTEGFFQGDQRWAPGTETGWQNPKDKETIALQVQPAMRLSPTTGDPGLESADTDPAQRLQRQITGIPSSQQKENLFPGTPLYSSITREKESYSYSTSASILTTKGVIKIWKVWIDERSLLNLIPRPVAVALDLKMCPTNTHEVNVANYTFQTDHYCCFNIQIAGVQREIMASVVYELPYPLLGRVWIRSVNLMKDCNSDYYIPDLDGEMLHVARVDQTDPDSQYTTASAPVFNESERGKWSIEEVENDELLQGFDFVGENDEDFDGDDEFEEEGDVVGKGGPDHEPVENEIGVEDDRSYHKLWDKFECEGNNESDTDNNSDKGDRFEYESSEYGQENNESDTGGGLFEADVESGRNSNSKSDHGGVFDDYNDCDHREQSDPNQSTENESWPDGCFPLFSENSKGASDIGVSDLLKDGISNYQATEIIKAIREICETKSGSYFKAPVSEIWPQYAQAYLTQITCPIDLFTIKSKMEHNAYSSMNDLKADISLIYQNSINFNGVDHAISQAALKVQNTLLKAIGAVSRDGAGASI